MLDVSERLAGAAAGVLLLLPPQVKQCVAKIAGMGVEEVEAAYGLPSLHTAEALRNRSLGAHGCLRAPVHTRPCTRTWVCARSCTVQ